MHSISAFQAEKEKRSGSAFIRLIEIEYAPGQFVRYARYNTVVTFEGKTWTPFPIAGTRGPKQSTDASIPAFDLNLSNVGREIGAILEVADIEGRPGRLLRVHPGHLGDATAKREDKFIVLNARVSGRDAFITCTPLRFDPLTKVIPKRKVTSRDFPGIGGARGLYVR